MATPSQRFELMPDEKLVYKGFVTWICGGWSGRKRCNGYLTSHRMVVCSKMTSYFHNNQFYLIGQLGLFHQSKKIAFEFPLADVLKFGKVNLPRRTVYVFELQDERRYVVNFQSPHIEQFSSTERWVAAIQAALQSVRKD